MLNYSEPIHRIFHALADPSRLAADHARQPRRPRRRDQPLHQQPRDPPAPGRAGDIDRMLHRPAIALAGAELPVAGIAQHRAAVLGHQHRKSTGPALVEPARHIVNGLGGFSPARGARADLIVKDFGILTILAHYKNTRHHGLGYNSDTTFLKEELPIGVM